MIDWRRYLPGVAQDDELDPIAKTLRLLGQGAQDVGAGIGQGVQDVGSGLSSAGSAAGSALGQPFQGGNIGRSASDIVEAARSYLPDFSPQPDGGFADVSVAAPPQRPTPVSGWEQQQPQPLAGQTGLSERSYLPTFTPAATRTPASFAPEDPSSQTIFPSGTPEPPAPEGGMSLGSLGRDIGSTIATEGIARPISRPVANAIRALQGRGPETPEEEAAPVTLSTPFGTLTAPNSARDLDVAARETARSLGANVSAVTSGLESGSYGQAGLGALGVVGDLAPSTTLARQLNELVPKAPTPWGELGAGDVVMTAALVRDAGRLGYGAARAGGRTLAAVAHAIQEGVPAERFGQWASRRGEAAAGGGAPWWGGLQDNAERVAQLDARMAAEGSVAAPGTLGALPEPGGARRGSPTVEVLQDRLDEATQAWRRATEAGDTDMAAIARSRAVDLQGALADARNARLDLEPAITSDVGRRFESLPLAEETADTLGGAGSRRADVDDLGGPMSVVPDLSGRMNVTAGALPADRGTGALGAVNRATGESLFGGVSGAAVGGLAPAETEEERRAHMLTGAGLGLVGGPGLSRGVGAIQRAAGARSGGALGAFGVAPGAGGAPQPGPGFFAQFPGVQQAITASQARAANMAARGQQPLGPLAWTGRFLESVGHSSMLGIRSATTNLIGNVAEPIWSLPKEPARAVQRAAERGNPAALREPGEMAVGAAHGLWNAGGEMVDALAARGRYYSPDQPMLSQQTVNPFSHALATAAELGGRVVSAVPDALFGSIARGAGEHREASQIATNAGLRGQPWKDRVSQILADRDAIMAGTPPADPQRLADAQQTIKAGGLYAKDQTFQNELGTIGTGVRKVARLGDAPVVGKLVTPYFNTPWNMKLRLAERTPLGLGMNTTNRPGTMRTRFDKYYDAAAGSALIAGLVAGPAAQGRITGSGPDDDGQRALMRDNGWLPQSTLVQGEDGQDYYVQNSKFGIYGPLLNLVGEIHDAAHYGKKDATVEQQLVGTARRFGKMFQNEAQLQGIADLLGAITDPAQNLRGYAGQLATRVTPYAATIRDISTSQDTQERQPDRGKQVSMGEEILGRWQQGTGQRSELPVKEGLRGPEENPSPGIWAFFPKASKARNDPVVETFLNANVDIPRERTAVSVENKIPAAQRPSGQPSSYQVPLTPAQTRLWENARNREIVRLTEKALADPRWEQMAPGAQQELLQSYVGASARVADTSILTRPEMQAVTAQAIREQQSKAAEQYRPGSR